MRTGTTQIVTVAPWFDITNSHQRYERRTHRWRAPQLLPEYLPELIPALPGLDALSDPHYLPPKAPASDLPVTTSNAIRL